MREPLLSSIHEAFTKDKYKLITQIEKDFISYLKYNNPYFYKIVKLANIHYLFTLYDKYYFSENLSQNIHIFISISNKLTRSAGMLKYNHRLKKAHITVSIPLIFGAFLKENEGYLVNGIFCRNPVEALMRVMEHELTHLIEFILYNDSNCSRPRFQKHCYDLFGHTGNKHLLGQVIPEPVSVVRFRKGDNVSFEHDGITHHGVIKRITKRATVIVDETKKYYVPLELLKII